jgi:hypothetical protein
LVRVRVRVSTDTAMMRFRARMRFYVRVRGTGYYELRDVRLFVPHAGLTTEDDSGWKRQPRHVPEGLG